MPKRGIPGGGPEPDPNQPLCSVTWIVTQPPVHPHRNTESYGVIQSTTDESVSWQVAQELGLRVSPVAVGSRASRSAQPFDTQEVTDSSSVGPTILFNHLAIPIAPLQAFCDVDCDATPSNQAIGRRKSAWRPMGKGPLDRSPTYPTPRVLRPFGHESNAPTSGAIRDPREPSSWRQLLLPPQAP